MVARRAHNPEAAGSSPVPATKNLVIPMGTDCSRWNFFYSIYGFYTSFGSVNNFGVDTILIRTWALFIFEKVIF